MGKLIYLLLGISLCVHLPSVVGGPVVGDGQSVETITQDTIDAYERYKTMVNNQMEAIMKQMVVGLLPMPPQMAKSLDRSLSKSTSLVNSEHPITRMVSMSIPFDSQNVMNMANAMKMKIPSFQTITYPNQQRTSEQISKRNTPYVPNNTKKSVVDGGTFNIKRFPDGSYEALGVRVPANFKFTPEVLDAYTKQIVMVHNEYRTKHGVPSLILDPKISEYSQMWADHLMDIYTLKHSPHEMRPSYGENIYFAGVSYVTAKEAVGSWYEEAENVNYNYDRNAPTKDAGHFTQLMWRNSQYIGVGVASDKEKGIFVVCNYKLPGNVEGEYTKNVPRPKF